MDLVTLDEDYQQETFIQSYDSLIWTERFGPLGDFQIKTGDVDGFMNLLPKGTVLSLRDSTVPMIVTRHEIERKKNQPVILTIKGQEFTKILGQRQAIQSVVAALGEWTVVAKQPSDVAHYIIYKVCVEGICDVNDIFPPDQVQFIVPDDYLEASRPNRQFTVTRGNLLATVLGLLQTEALADPDTIPPSPPVVPHGIRAMRPDSSGSAIGIEIYKGTDRSADIRFEATREMLDDGSYLFTDEPFGNEAYVLGPSDAFKLHKGTEKSGLDRRVILVDASSSGITDDDALKTEGARALGNAKEIARFDGSINQDLSPYKYNVDYALGDTVMLVGDYGLVTPARVTEYIRSKDATGTKAFPTLVSITQEEA